MKRIFDKTTVKFLLVGVVNTLVGSAVMFLLYHLAHWSYWPSVCANYLCGGIVSYFLNKYFTFQSTERSLAQVGRFVLTVAVCMLLAYGIAKPAARWVLSGAGERVQETGAMVVGIGLYTALNYLGQKFFAFREEK